MLPDIYPVINMVLNWGARRWNAAVTIRELLDYLCDRKSLIQRRQALLNPEETLHMLHALSGDIQYLENINFMTETGGMTVCDLLDEMVNKGLEQGRKEGIQEGIRALISTCRRLKLSFDETSATVQKEFSLGDDEIGKNMKLYW